MQINIEYNQKFNCNNFTQKIITAFGLKSSKTNLIVKNFNFPFEFGKNYYICGYSGSGKSSLLNEIYSKIKNENTIYIKTWQNLNIENLPIIQFFEDIDSDTKIRLLSKCGLGEAWKFISNYNDLSDGEKFRFILYHSIMTLKNKKNSILIFDEFCATLDRITAKAIANNLAKISKDYDITMILASAHDDLTPYLNFDYNIFKEFDENVEITK